MPKINVLRWLFFAGFLICGSPSNVIGQIPSHLPSDPSFDSLDSNSNQPQPHLEPKSLDVNVREMEAKSHDDRKMIWGLIGGRGFLLGDQIAPNGLEYRPLFSLDTSLNFWFWREQRLYGYVETRFWGQRAGAGVTNPSQGAFDFSKRELDLDVGLAWNYSGPFELRTFAYSMNNLNRGNSSFSPAGYNDGVGIENRWYFGKNYESLGTSQFDIARTSYLSLGFYPTKEMTDDNGNRFKPGLFARARVTYDIMPETWYLYFDSQFICFKSGPAKLFNFDGGTAFRPFASNSRVEFRFGSENKCDIQLHSIETELYFGIRLTF